MRRVIKFLLTLIVGIVLIWLGFWWYAEVRLQSGFTDWAEAQATKGWKISYTAIRRGDSVLDAAVTVTDLSMQKTTGAGELTTISLPAVTLRIQAFSPLVFHVDLPDRINVTLGNRLGIVLTSGSITQSENLDPAELFNRTAEPFRGGAFAASDVDVLASGGSLLVLHIDNIASHFDLNPHAGAGQTALSTHAAFDGFAVSPLLARIASLPFNGRIAHLDVAFRASGPVPADLPSVLEQFRVAPHDLQAQKKLIMPVIHEWAEAGGTASEDANLDLGPSQVHAAGTLKFDANLQPAGTGELTANHLDQLADALGNAYPALQADISQLEAEFSQYLGNTPKGGQVLTMHVVYGRQGVIINGKKAADMPQIDWNAEMNPAANPPATPVNAPGDAPADAPADAPDPSPNGSAGH